MSDKVSIAQISWKPKLVFDKVMHLAPICVRFYDLPDYLADSPDPV